MSTCSINLLLQIWNHPDVLQKFLDRQADNDFDVDVALPSASKDAAVKSTKMKKSGSDLGLDRMEKKSDSLLGLSEKSSEISYDWVGYLSCCDRNCATTVFNSDIISLYLELPFKHLQQSTILLFFPCDYWIL